jgi:PAS domain S-box-containing protein
VNFGGKEYRCTFARDITARKEADKQLRLQGRTLEAAANAIVITDRDGIMVWVNPAFTRLTGYTAEEMVGQNPRTLQSGQHDRSFYENLWKTILSGCVWRGEVVNRRKDGSLYTEEMTITPVLSTEGSISHFIAVKEDISARKQAEEELRRAEEKYRHIFENAVIGIFQTTPDGRYLSLNPKLAHMYGNSSPEERMAEVTDIGRQAYVNPSVREEFKRRVEEQGEVSGFEYQVYRKDGSKMWLLENARAVRDSNGKTLYYEGTVEDISEHKQLEDQFRQAQKMEAVGRLAGGVAHDMNNMLGVIIGYSELLRERFDPADPLARQLGEVKKAADRAASLTRQLLAFSRKQVLEPRILDLNGVVENLSKMLRRLIGEDVELVIKPHATPVLVKVDPGQMEQVLMNLAINARDAMPRGGKLVIETTPVHLDETYARQHVPVEPGSYVLLSVSDSGCGMNAKVLPHVFEPFFTTKEVGKGTGLGLSTVYGIVKQSGGYIWVYSEPDQGTTFKIYLPQASTTASPEIPQGEAAAAQARGSGTILLVEDEEALREVAQISLQSAGYTVLVAADGPTALEMARQHKGSVDLLLTDVIMPRMSGREVAEAVATERKNMKVLYMSGFTDDLVAQHGLLKAGVVLLQKPFTLTALLGKVREVLKATAPEGLPEPPSKKSRMSRAKRQGSGS